MLKVRIKYRKIGDMSEWHTESFVIVSDIWFMWLYYKVLIEVFLGQSELVLGRDHTNLS